MFLACRSSVISLIMRFYDVSGGAVRGCKSTSYWLERGHSAFGTSDLVQTLHVS